MEEFKQLSAESIQKFKEGISMVLSKWWALQMAIENNWGGPHSLQKSLDFSSRIFNFFHQPNRKEMIYIDELEDLLWEGMASLSTTAEDGSIEEVAYQLMCMHEECLEGNYESIEKLRQVKGVPIPIVKQDPNASDEDEEVDDESVMNDEASGMVLDSNGSMPNPNLTQVLKNISHSQQMSDAEDGWVTVSSRKNRGRKH